MSKKLIRLLVGAALTVAVAYVLVAHMDKVRANVSQRDSIAYWAAGKFLIHRGNPHDVDNTFDLETEQATRKASQFCHARRRGRYSSFCR